MYCLVMLISIYNYLSFSVVFFSHLLTLLFWHVQQNKFLTHVYTCWIKVWVWFVKFVFPMVFSVIRRLVCLQLLKLGQAITHGEKHMKLNPRFKVCCLIRMIFSRLFTFIRSTAMMLNSLTCFISFRCNPIQVTKIICLPKIWSVRCCCLSSAVVHTV